MTVSLSLVVLLVEPLLNRNKHLAIKVEEIDNEEEKEDEKDESGDRAKDDQ